MREADATRRDQAALARGQHLYWKALKMTEDPEQIETLHERGFEVTRSEGGEDAQNAGGKLFKPHSIFPEEVFNVLTQKCCAIQRPSIISPGVMQWE